jgi:hypothetical protein
MPGAAPFAHTWLRYLKSHADALAPRLTAQVVAEERLDHKAGHHEKPVPSWPCSLTNSRAYCPDYRKVTS